MRELTLRDYKRRVARVLAHIQRHLDDPLAIQELAALACFSPYHFHRIFKGMVGESVKEYVRRLRLERAATRLAYGSEAVLDIALDAGYESHEAFTRSFKAAFGAAPSQFRRMRRMQFAESSSGIHYRPDTPLRDFRSLHRGGTMDVKIEQRPPLRVAFLRHVGPYDECGKVWDRLLPLLGKDGYLAGATLLGVCYDDPDVTPPEKIRYDACVTVDDDFQAHAGIQVQVIAGGEYARTTHLGPYRELGRTYAEFLGQWLPRSGRELRDLPCFEVYLNDPSSTEPQDLLTDIYAPLAPEKSNQRG